MTIAIRWLLPIKKKRTINNQFKVFGNGRYYRLSKKMSNDSLSPLSLLSFSSLWWFVLFLSNFFFVCDLPKIDNTKKGMII